VQHHREDPTPGNDASTTRRAAAPAPDAWTPAQRVAWLERFYDLVFVACVGRFANELGTATGPGQVAVVLAWLAGLWLAWFLVVTRLNRFPDERAATRAALLGQLLALTLAAAAALSTTVRDDRLGSLATAAMALGVAVLYATIPREAGADARLVRAQVLGNSAVGASILLALVLPTPVGGLISGVVALSWFVVVLVWYLPRVARARPVEPRHAGERYGQLFLVLMGLSFLKVAFEPGPEGAVAPAVVVGAFAAGFALWSLYVDGVLPLGFPSAVVNQQRWLVAQLVLALGVTVAAAAVVAVPPTTAGMVSPRQAVLEGAAITAMLVALAALARFAEHPQPRSVTVRLAGAGTVVVLAMLAGATGQVPDAVFSLGLAVVIVASAALDAAGRRHALTPG
jgi:low temperature requirement protein LtrA